MSTLLDTNILTRSSQEDHPQFPVASRAVELLIARGERVCIVPQNLYEFWAVATRPAEYNGLGMTGEEARRDRERTGCRFAASDDRQAGEQSTGDVNGNT